MIAKIVAKAVAEVVLVCLMIGGCSKPSVGNNLTVYHVGFNVDTITGFHESNFPKAGCKGKINEQIFLSLIGSITNDVHYRNDDVKSLIISPNMGKYYIDYYGNVRNGNNFYKIDTEKFEKNVIC
jgi:hypothetical protein